MIAKYAKTRIAKAANALGYKIERLSPPAPVPHYLQLDPRYAEILKAAEPYTMTSYERVAAFVDAVNYVVRDKIPGAIVECGVWRGGSMMAAAFTLLKHNDIRDLYLFDTYAGMSAPTHTDIDHSGTPAIGRYMKAAAGDHNEWCYARLE